ncbi:MAG: beta-lactam antibiotic acylase [Chitinophagales bacterium]|nr:MAG: beta-lactam antibiotic acylase [Chitinophagales bacterium]
MSAFRFILSASLTLLLCMLFSYKIGPLPPLGYFLSPFTGFWQNAETAHQSPALPAHLSGLQEEVQVKLDTYRVPHIFARNNYDLYFMQGYVVARDRLWQMEFISRAASGRLSEIFGPRALEYDRTQRRSGLPYAAHKALEQFPDDSVSREVLQAFADGVNAFIGSLSYKNLPLEYKLLDYAPESWKPYNTVLLLKYMANMLTGKDYDIEYTNILQFLDPVTFDLLFPDFPEGIDPIIPKGTPFRRTLADTSKIGSVRLHHVSSHACSLSFTLPGLPEYQPGVGSNNWAISADKSTTGYPILCNDPHLKLQVPSIWYMMQLQAPGINVYGVTIPGAPGIIIGFNENIAWGVTNGSMDVRDWYRIVFKDEAKDAYLFDNKWLNTKKVVEEIKMRNKPSYFDTVIYTHHGPVVYDGAFGYQDTLMLALRWTAHNPSNELKTFYLLNRASNYNDYLTALNYFECPGQNFVFASIDGDIAIKQQGRFVLRRKNEGKFILDGTSSATDWQGYIPSEDNPHIKNPSRGFVSSANQHPTDSTYPYYYTGIYEYYRNRRINTFLQGKEKFSPEDMKTLQNDNYNLMASEVLPYLLTQLDVSALSKAGQEAFNDLASWNFYNNPDLTAPTRFTVMWNVFYQSLWDEFLAEKNKPLTAPDPYNTTSFIINHPNHPLIDNHTTPEKETLNMLVEQAFTQMIAQINSWTDSTGMVPVWAAYKDTRLSHFLPVESFHVKHLPVGGDLHIVNATNRTHGQSWKMVVALGRPVQAWGVYPGGQSGNPGSPWYNSYTIQWVNGQYYPLLFLQHVDEGSEEIIFQTSIKPRP